jgi:hypothetical protein
VECPKDRWIEIAVAEEFTGEGDKLWERLSKKFSDTYLRSTNPDITEQGNPVPVEA